eukprot:6190858-Pleurochrysis_carterae.AAC.3
MEGTGTPDSSVRRCWGAPASVVDRQRPRKFKFARSDTITYHAHGKIRLIGEDVRGARRRWRRMRESFCGDGVGALGRQNMEAVLLRIDKDLGVVTARPDFCSPRSSSRSWLTLVRLSTSAPRCRSRRRAPCCLSSRSALRILGSFGGSALSVYSGLRICLWNRKCANREMFCTLRWPSSHLF